MPELPEVEVIKRGLNEALSSEPKLARFEFRRKDLRDPMPLAQLQEMQNASFAEVTRRAKYLLFRLRRGKQNLGFLSHLGMTGTWRVEEPQFKLGTHDHILIYLSDQRILVYRDPRRFGIFDIWNPNEARHPRLDHLGPEPLESFWTGEVLWKHCRGRAQNIKTVLMDQRCVVGVGNIYASEALFRSGIRPARPAGKVTLKEANLLVASIKEVLQTAIDAGGSTLRDFYSLGGLQGGFQDLHLVYDREGQACPRCGKPIRQKVLGGRSSFWCASCQS